MRRPAPPAQAHEPMDAAVREGSAEAWPIDRSIDRSAGGCSDRSSGRPPHPYIIRTPTIITRHVRDPYVRAAKKDDLRSRAAFKLKEMQEKCRLIRRGDVVVDIGCAPGGWAELTAALVRGDKKGTGTGAGARGNRGGRVVGIDLLPVQPPVPGATLLQGDFTDPKSRAELLRLATAPLVDGGRPARVDVVLSDVAPNFSGDAYTDHVRTLQLCYEVKD